MTIKERYLGIMEYFQQEQPNPETELKHRDPFELLVAVMLSAQCTDKRINMVTPALFDAYPTPQAMAAASVEDILEYVKSVSYPNSKAAHLQAMARKLVDEFDGHVPDNMKELTSLPGVGRKTANVVMGAAFGKATIPVMMWNATSCDTFPRNCASKPTTGYCCTGGTSARPNAQTA